MGKPMANPNNNDGPPLFHYNAIKDIKGKGWVGREKRIQGII
jgi:hypothetical protein